MTVSPLPGLSGLKAGCSSWHLTNSVKALKVKTNPKSNPNPTNPPKIGDLQTSYTANRHAYASVQVNLVIHAYNWQWTHVLIQPLYGHTHIRSRAERSCWCSFTVGMIFLTATRITEKTSSFLNSVTYNISVPQLPSPMYNRTSCCNSQQRN